MNRHQESDGFQRFSMVCLRDACGVWILKFEVGGGGGMCGGQAAITELPKDMSTKQCRFEPCDLGGFLLEKVKRGFLVRKASLICVVRS